MNFDILLGRVIEKIDFQSEEIIFHCNTGRSFIMRHHQDCCEYVSVEEVIGDLDDLIDTPILEADERTRQNPNASDSGTWTFYELRTNKGSVTIRWYGSSNGYYSEEVSFYEIE